MPVLKNAKHERFAHELAKGKSASEAYVLAGYKANDGNSIRLKGNERISARVEEILKGAADRTGITVAKVFEELGRIGFSNMLDYVSISDDGDPRVDLAKMNREQAAAVQEITINTRTERGGEDKPDAQVQSVKFRLLDKRAALVDIGKHLGMFKERVEHTGKDGGPIVTADLSDTDVARKVAFLLARGSRAADKPTEH